MAGQREGCLRADFPLFLQRQDSGPCNIWLDSWAFSFPALGLVGCRYVENVGDGHECRACKSAGIFVSQALLISVACFSLASSPETSFFAFHLSLFLPFPQPCLET